MASRTSCSAVRLSPESRSRRTASNAAISPRTFGSSRGPSPLPERSPTTPCCSGECQFPCGEMRNRTKRSKSRSRAIRSGRRPDRMARGVAPFLLLRTARKAARSVSGGSRREVSRPPATCLSARCGSVAGKATWKCLSGAPIRALETARGRCARQSGMEILLPRTPRRWAVVLRGRRLFRAGTASRARRAGWRRRCLVGRNANRGMDAGVRLAVASRNRRARG